MSSDDAHTPAARPLAEAVAVTLRLAPAQLLAVDAWAAQHGDISRSEAIGRLLERGLGDSTHLMRSS